MVLESSQPKSCPKSRNVSYLKIIWESLKIVYYDLIVSKLVMKYSWFPTAFT